MDEPTTFWYDNKPYEPSNFKHEFYGTVTLRQALAHSMNVATVKVGEMVGFDTVVDLAKKAGLNYDIQPTPAVALGSYDVTPMEMAGAYTIFANQGVYVKPNFVSMVRAQNGKDIYNNKTEERTVLDPRVAYLMTNLMEEVMRSGTAAGVRARGFSVPAAGKTGTSTTMAGLPAIPPTCCASCGWASTITATWTWKARTRRCPSGRNS